MRIPPTIAICAGLLGLFVAAPLMGQDDGAIPQLSGIWDGGRDPAPSMDPTCRDGE